MKNYLITEDQLKKIVDEINNENQDSVGSFDFLSNLFKSDDEKQEVGGDIKPNTTNSTQVVSSDDPIIRFFNSIK